MAANGNRELYCPDSGLTKLELFCLRHGVPETGGSMLLSQAMEKISGLIEINKKP